MTAEQIIDEIKALLANGIPMQEVRINDGDDRWGQSGACTTVQCEALISDWESAGQDCSDLAPLLTVDEWMQKI